MATIKSGWAKPITGRLKDYATATTGTLLLGSIQAHMIKESAKPSTRRQDIIHPSEMAKTGWCPRSTYLRIKACREASDPYLKPAEFIGVQLLNIFDEGHAIHDKWQRRLWDMGLLGGYWQCNNCRAKFEAVSPDECRLCKSDKFALIYREVPLKADQYLISGSADGEIPSKKALIEIKSVGVGTARIEAPDIYKANSDGQKIDLQGLWKDIKEPFPSHIRQGQLYLGICDLMGFDFTDIVFLYESKFNQGAKEFVVKYDPSVSQPLFDQAEQIKLALEGLADSPQCPHGTCKDCEVYGTEKSDPVRLGSVSTTSAEVSSIRNGTESTIPTRRRSARPTGKVVRPPRS